MALPPNTADSFVREVDENLRRDQIETFFRRNGKWIIGGVILFLAIVGSYFAWQSYSQKRASTESEQLSDAFDRVQDGNTKGATKALEGLSDSATDTTRASALLTRADVAAQNNDAKAAAALFKQVEDDSGLPQPYRDLALVRRTMVEYDSLKPDEVIARLANLAKPGEPFFGTAGEMTAMAMIAKGDKAGAGQLFAKLAADQQVPATIRDRAVQIAGSLGVDATASITAATPAK